MKGVEQHEPKSGEVLRESSSLIPPSGAYDFLSKHSSTILAAAIGAGIVAVVLRIDGALNRDLVDTLKANWHPLRCVFSHHALTALSEFYPGVVEAGFGGLVALEQNLK